MKKTIRKWLKDEKRIIRFLYRKGLLPVEAEELYWAEYRYARQRKRVSDPVVESYLPQVFYSETITIPDNDFNEYSVTEMLPGVICNVILCEEKDYNKCQDCAIMDIKRKNIIKQFNYFETVRCDSRINKILIFKRGE